MKPNGYSLLEMLFVLAIAAATIGVSVPFLIKYRENSDFESAAGKVVVQMRRTKMLAVTKGETYAVCVPPKEPNSGNSWRFFTIRKLKGKTCADHKGKAVTENIVPYRVVQSGKKTETKAVSFLPRGTSTSKSFCIGNKRGDRWKKITVSAFARITVTSHRENPCD